MSEEESVYLKLRFEPEEIAVETGDPSDYLYELEGQVLPLGDDDRPKVGRFRDADSALNDGVSWFDVLDERAETIGYYEYLYGNDGSVSDALEDLLGDMPINSNALILDRLEILPEFRSRRFGLLVLRRLIQRFSAGVGMIAMKPFPLQFEAGHDGPEEWRDQLRLARFTTDKRTAFAKLRAYYCQLGFKHLPRSEYMFLAGDTPLPKTDELRA